MIQMNESQKPSLIITYIITPENDKVTRNGLSGDYLWTRNP